MVLFKDLKRSNVLATVINGMLTDDEIDLLHKKLHEILQSDDKARWYFEMNDFDVWLAKGLWEYLKTDANHADNYEKIAMVGEKKWQNWISQLMKPFASAEIKYFDLEDKELAKQWILE